MSIAMKMVHSLCTQGIDTMLDILLIVYSVLLVMCMIVLIYVSSALVDKQQEMEEEVDYWRQQALTLNRSLRLDEDVSV